MNKLAVILFLLLICLVESVFGQQRTGYLEGTLMTRIEGTHGL